MSLLFDSHALLWWMVDDPRLPGRVRSAISTRGVGVVSAVSVWEVEIKRAIGKLRIDADFAATVLASGLSALPITFGHAVAAGRLPPHHTDPFDRMLVAQAVVEGLVLVTRDRQLQQYDVPTLWD